MRTSAILEEKKHPGTLRPFIVLALLIALAAGCDKSSTGVGEPGNPFAGPWEVVAPEAVGLDRSLLEEAETAAANQRSVISLLVVKNGRLAWENYFQGNTANNLNDVRSVTKSVVSLLTRIALEEGFIQSVDDSIASYISPQVVDLPPDQQGITIRHLLTMSGGWSWNETGGPDYGNWMSSGDYIQYLVDRPLSDPPGSDFTYNSAAVHLLGVVLAEATGMSLPLFADRYLFDKLGIETAAWEVLPGEYVNGGAGIDLRPRDLARLGLLMLRSGLAGSEQVVPASWVSTAMQPQYDWRSSYGPLQNYSYGYLWWLEEQDDGMVALAWGFGGQFICVKPAADLVVVVTSNWGGASPDELELAALDIIFNKVIPAVR